jgi:hypothetical protein
MHCVGDGEQRRSRFQSPGKPPSADQSGWKITACWTADESRGSRSKVRRWGRPYFAKVIARAAKAESGREIGTEMGIEQHGGSGIDEIERLHYLLPFAVGIVPCPLPMSLKSICQQVMGAGRSIG